MTHRLSQYSDGQVETHIKMIEVMSKRANDKLYLFLDQDILAYTILSLFKANRRKFQLTSEKQANLMNTTLFIIVIQVTLSACLWGYIFQYMDSPNDANRLYIDPLNQPVE